MICIPLWHFSYCQFCFCQCGGDFPEGGTEQLFHNVPLGIALGLFIGKQVGIFGLCWVAIKLKIARLPKGMSWGSLYGTSRCVVLVLL